MLSGQLTGVPKNYPAFESMVREETMLKRIHTLLVTPDKEWGVKLYAQLIQSGFEQVSQATNAVTALSLFQEGRPDLVVIEVELPDADGLMLCRMIQTLYPTVKVVLVANDASLQMAALQASAAGCINHDFPLSEWPGLLCYVNSGGAFFSQTVVEEALVRASLTKTEATPVSIGPLVVDMISRRVTLSGRRVNLTPREFALLACLARNVGRVVTFDRLLNEAWGYDSEMGTEAQVRMYVTRLRRKLIDDTQTPDFIVSERGIGYRLRSQVQWRQKADHYLLSTFNRTRLSVAGLDMAP
jgi:two-component system KDP operon response regulator KdpE